jgi:hypothetical protein
MAVLNKQSIVKEALARQIKPVAKPIVLAENFPKQNAFINDTNRYIAAQCSRRAGKTNGLAYRFFKAMEKYPKSQCIYLGLTRDSAKGAMWPVLQEINDKYQLGCDFVESKLTMKHPNGAVLILLGADMPNYIKRLRGRKFPGVAIDEAQDFGGHLESLIDDVLTPAIADYSDGWLAVTGTPGPVPQGLFFDITCHSKYGFSLHKWTLYDNPNMPNPQEVVRDLKIRKEWSEDNPTLKREWLNEWVLDVQSLWVRYSEKLNDFSSMPTGTGYKWNYILGVDIGFKDADAIAVVAWSEKSPETYLIEEVITRKQGISSLIAQIDALQKKYDAYKIVMDEGGLGKKIAEDIRQRFGCPIEPADKVRKQDNVELLNDSLRLGKFKAKKDSQFALDSYMVQIDWDKSTPKHIQIKKTFHSDIIDAVLYAFRDSYAYTHRPEPEKPKPGTKEWADQQHSEMFEAELEGLLEEQDFIKKYGGGY